MNSIVQIPFFQSFPVSCGTTTRHFPLKVVQTKEFVRNQDALALGEKLLRIRPKNWVQAGQPHGTLILRLAPNSLLLPSSSIDLLSHADGLISLNAGQVLSILTADCLPIFFYLEDPPAAGLVHAGWRGAAK